MNPLQSPMHRQNSPTFTCCSQIGLPCFPLNTFDCFVALLFSGLENCFLPHRCCYYMSLIAVGDLSPFTCIFGFIWISWLFCYRCYPWAWVLGLANLVGFFNGKNQNLCYCYFHHPRIPSYTTVR